MDTVAPLETDDEDIRWKQRLSNFEKAFGHCLL
jgi:hypothetical protein